MALRKQYILVNPSLDSVLKSMHLSSEAKNSYYAFSHRSCREEEMATLVPIALNDDQRRILSILLGRKVCVMSEDAYKSIELNVSDTLYICSIDEFLPVGSKKEIEEKIYRIEFIC